MIIIYEAPMGCGMTFASLSILYREYLEGKRVLSGYKWIGDKYRLLTKEEFLKEIKRYNTDMGVSRRQ